MSEKRKLQKSRHDAYVKEQGKKVVTYLVATLIILFVLVFVATFSLLACRAVLHAMVSSMMHRTILLIVYSLF